MDRRSFLSTLAGAAAALAFDPERLLWVPGAKRIFIPATPLIDFPLKYYSVDVVISGPDFDKALKAWHNKLATTPYQWPDGDLFGFAITNSTEVSQ